MARTEVAWSKFPALEAIILENKTSHDLMLHEPRVLVLGGFCLRLVWKSVQDVLFFVEKPALVITCLRVNNLVSMQSSEFLARNCERFSQTSNRGVAYIPPTSSDFCRFASEAFHLPRSPA